MEINTHNEINGEIARKLRLQAILPQKTFWGSVGVSQSTGSQYERGHRSIDESVRILLFIKYIARLQQDTGTILGAQELCALSSK